MISPAQCLLTVLTTNLVCWLDSKWVLSSQLFSWVFHYDCSHSHFCPIGLTASKWFHTKSIFLFTILTLTLVLLTWQLVSDTCQVQLVAFWLSLLPFLSCCFDSLWVISCQVPLCACWLVALPFSSCWLDRLWVIAYQTSWVSSDCSYFPSGLLAYQLVSDDFMPGPDMCLLNVFNHTLVLLAW